MPKQDATQLLKEKIQEKESECAYQKILLNEQFELTKEKLKPMNLIKDTFSSPELKDNLVDSAIGLASGYIARKAIVISSKNPLVKLLGTVIGAGVANLMTKHPDGIKSIGGNIINALFKRKKEDTETT